MSSAVREPSSNRRSGCSRRAMASISGERSTPKASSPRPWRRPVRRPGPQPTSVTGRGPSRRTVSAKARSMARAKGSSHTASPTASAYSSATAPQAERVAVRNSGSLMAGSLRAGNRSWAGGSDGTRGGAGLSRAGLGEGGLVVGAGVLGRLARGVVEDHAPFGVGFADPLGGGGGHLLGHVQHHRDFAGGEDL